MTLLRYPVCFFIYVIHYNIKKNPYNSAIVWITKFHKLFFGKNTILQSINRFRKTVSTSALLSLSDAPACAGILELCHPPENTVFLREKFSGASFLGNSAIRENNDFIRRLHGPHPMSDNQYSLSGKQPRQSALYLCFILYIKRSRGFIQKKDGSIFQKRTGNRNPLALPSAVFAVLGAAALAAMKPLLIARSEKWELLISETVCGACFALAAVFDGRLSGLALIMLMQSVIPLVPDAFDIGQKFSSLMFREKKKTAARTFGIACCVIAAGICAYSVFAGGFGAERYDEALKAVIAV